jgi:hypothetical protein
MREYVADCELCNGINAPDHAHSVLNVLLSLPSWPCEGFILHVVSHSLESTASGYTGIIAIDHCLTNIVTCLSFRKRIASPELVPMFFKQVICK